MVPRESANSTENEQMWWILILPLHATSCHFMPLQVACHFKWRMPLQVACHFEWRMPLQMAHATSSGVSHREHATSCHFKWRMPPQVACHFEWRMPLQMAYATSSGVPLRVAYATSNGACHFKWRVAPWACHFMPLHATSSGGCHFKWRATSSGVCHFKWRMPLQVACRTVSMPLHATSCHFKWREVAWSGEIGLRTSCVLNEILRRCSSNESKSLGDQWVFLVGGFNPSEKY